MNYSMEEHGHIYDQYLIHKNRGCIFFGQVYGLLFPFQRYTMDMSIYFKKWKALIGVCLLIPAIIFDLQWFWGVLVIVSFVHILRTGKILLFEIVERRETPTLYWIITILWLFVGLWSLYDYFIIK